MKKSLWMILILSLLASKAFPAGGTSSADVNNPDYDCQCGLYGGFETGILETSDLFYFPQNLKVQWDKVRFGAVITRNNRVLSVQWDLLFSNPTLDGNNDTFLSLNSELKWVPTPGKIDLYLFGGFGQAFALGQFGQDHYRNFPVGAGLEFFPDPQNKFFSGFVEAECDIIYKDPNPAHVLFFAGPGVTFPLSL